MEQNSGKQLNKNTGWKVNDKQAPPHKSSFRYVTNETKYATIGRT